MGVAFKDAKGIKNDTWKTLIRGREQADRADISCRLWGTESTVNFPFPSKVREEAEPISDYGAHTTIICIKLYINLFL